MTLVPVKSSWCSSRTVQILEFFQEHTGSSTSNLKEMVSKFTHSSNILSDHVPDDTMGYEAKWWPDSHQRYSYSCITSVLSRRQHEHLKLSHIAEARYTGTRHQVSSNRHPNVLPRFLVYVKANEGRLTRHWEFDDKYWQNSGYTMDVKSHECVCHTAEQGRASWSLDSFEFGFHQRRHLQHGGLAGNHIFSMG